MGKLFVIIFIFVICAIIWSLPLYITTNFVCWVFHLSFHITLLQSFAICLIITVIHDLLFGKESK